MDSLFHVGGKPFFSIGGQLNNSTSSDPALTEKAFKTCVGLGLNAVAAPVHWELFEKEEGAYDFAQIDMLMELARRSGLRLIPEIEKVAAYAKGDRITVADVEAVANHIPEAVVFDMTDYIAQKKYNTAMAVLAELISDKNNAPIAMVAMIGQQMRRLYGAKLVSAQPDGMKALMDACGIKYEFIAKKLIASARGFTLPQLVRAVELCADADYKMKSSSTDDTELLKELVLRIAAGEADA